MEIKFPLVKKLKAPLSVVKNLATRLSISDRLTSLETLFRERDRVSGQTLGDIKSDVKDIKKLMNDLMLACASKHSVLDVRLTKIESSAIGLQKDVEDNKEAQDLTVREQGMNRREKWTVYGLIAVSLITSIVSVIIELIKKI